MEQSIIEKPKQVSELVLERLRRDIVDATFEFGQKISEAQLSERYGVTKAPIRAAIIRLESEGLLTVRPQAGTFVIDPDIEDVRSLCELRIALETEAVRLAMERNRINLLNKFDAILSDMVKALNDGQLRQYLDLDSELHLAIIACSESPALQATFREKIDSQFAALRSRFGKEDNHLSTSIAEHKVLRETLASNNVSEMCTLMRSHVGNTEKYYQRMLKDA